RLGDTPTPRSSPTDVSPLPSPHVAFPSGSTTVSAAATTGKPGVANAWKASADSGRSPGPLLDTARPLITSETCTAAGMTERPSHGVASYRTTPVSACSERASV